MSKAAGRDPDRPQMARAKGGGSLPGGLVGPVTPGTSEVGTDAHLSSLFSPGLLVIVSLLSGREKTVKIRLTMRQRASPILGNLGEGGLSLPGFGLN